MANKKTVLRKTGGSGYVPGYGTVTNPEPSGSAWGGGWGNAIQTSLQNNPVFTPQTPQAPPPDPNAAAKAQYNSLIGDATNNATRGYGYALDDSVANEGAYGLDIGATLGARDPNLDPSAATQGSFDWNGVEATNPFSKAALLVRNYKQQQNRTTNGLAAQGQLYSGAMANQQGQDTFDFQSGQDSLSKALQGYLADEARKRRDAGVTRDQTINNAGLAGLQALLGGGS